MKKVIYYIVTFIIFAISITLMGIATYDNYKPPIDLLLRVTSFVLLTVSVVMALAKVIDKSISQSMEVQKKDKYEIGNDIFTITEIQILLLLNDDTLSEEEKGIIFSYLFNNIDDLPDYLIKIANEKNSMVISKMLYNL